MEDENYRFIITPLGGAMAKNDRIRRMIPDFEQGDIYFPTRLEYVTHEGKPVDLISEFITQELVPFPVGTHDDMLDSLARKKDMNITFPMTKPKVFHAAPQLKRFGHSGR